MNNKQISLLIVVALSLIAFAFGTASYLRDQDAKRQQMLEVNRDALSREHAPIYGSLDAKVRITEFFDPACETCRAFYPLVKQMVDESRGRALVSDADAARCVRQRQGKACAGSNFNLSFALR